MKQFILLATMLLTFSLVNAQTKVYKGTSSYSSDVICNLNNSKVYKKTSSYSSDVICNVSGSKVYKGTSSYSSDVLYNVSDGKVYKGTSSYSSDIVMTIKDGKIYKGTSTYSSDVIATIKDGKVYTGNSSYSSDIQFSIDGNVTIVEFVAIWYAVKYSYWYEAENVKTEIASQLNQDWLTSTGFVRAYSGISSSNKLENVTIELTLFGYFETEIRVFLDDKKNVVIKFRGINGVIDTVDMINLSASLNNSKNNLTQYFNWNKWASWLYL